MPKKTTPHEDVDEAEGLFTLRAIRAGWPMLRCRPGSLTGLRLNPASWIHADNLRSDARQLARALYHGGGSRGAGLSKKLEAAHRAGRSRMCRTNLATTHSNRLKGDGEGARESTPDGGLLNRRPVAAAWSQAVLDEEQGNDRRPPRQDTQGARGAARIASLVSARSSPETTRLPAAICRARSCTPACRSIS